MRTLVMMHSPAMARQLALEKAYKELNTFGKVMTKESADALGVPLGTTTYAVQMQELARKNAGRRSSNTTPAKTNKDVSRDVFGNGSYREVQDAIRTASYEGGNKRVDEYARAARYYNLISEPQMRGLISAYTR